MNLKQEFFALQYVKHGFDLDAAAKASKISKTKAKRWTKDRGITEYISVLNKDLEKVCKISKAKVVHNFIDLHDEAKKDRSFAAATTAMREVSAILGYNAPAKVDVSVDLSQWLTQQTIDVEVIENDV